MTRLALAALVFALLAGCGGSGDKTVAKVGGQPEVGTRTFVQLRNQLLGLLVYRAELKQGAERLGVTVSDAEVSKRLAAAPRGSGEEEGDINGDTYARDSAEAELLKEGIAAKVTRGITGKTLAERSARRNEALATYLTRLQRETTVRYEPGYAPGS